MKPTTVGRPTHSANHSRTSRVAERVAARMTERGYPIRPASVHAWLHSASMATVQEKVALVLEVCREMGASQLAAKILAPIRAVETLPPGRPLREQLHDLREAMALTEVMAARYFDQPGCGGKALKAALAWTAHTALGAHRLTPGESGQ